MNRLPEGIIALTNPPVYDGKRYTVMVMQGSHVRVRFDTDDRFKALEFYQGIQVPDEWTFHVVIWFRAEGALPRPYTVFWSRE